MGHENALWSTLSVTTSEGTVTRKVGHKTRLRITGATITGGGPGTGSRKTYKIDDGFREKRDEQFAQGAGGLSFVAYGPAIVPPDNGFSCVTGLAYAGGVVTVTRIGSVPRDAPSYRAASRWTEEIAIPVDAGSVLELDGCLPNLKPLSLAGLSAISLTEAAS